MLFFDFMIRMFWENIRIMILSHIQSQTNKWWRILYFEDWWHLIITQLSFLNNPPHETLEDFIDLNSKWTSLQEITEHNNVRNSTLPYYSYSIQYTLYTVHSMQMFCMHGISRQNVKYSTELHRILYPTMQHAWFDFPFPA